MSNPTKKVDIYFTSHGAYAFCEEERTAAFCGAAPIQNFKLSSKSYDSLKNDLNEVEMQEHGCHYVTTEKVVGDEFEWSHYGYNSGCDVVNLTPHDVVLRAEKGLVEDKVFRASGKIARVRESVTSCESYGLPCVRKNYDGVENLPPKKKGVAYIVSSFVFAACDREDVLAPDTGPDSAIRNEKGNIVAVKRFVSK